MAIRSFRYASTSSKYVSVCILDWATYFGACRAQLDGCRLETRRDSRQTGFDPNSKGGRGHKDTFKSPGGKALAACHVCTSRPKGSHVSTRPGSISGPAKRCSMGRGLPHPDRVDSGTKASTGQIQEALPDAPHIRLYDALRWGTSNVGSSPNGPFEPEHNRSNLR